MIVLLYVSKLKIDAVFHSAQIQNSVIAHFYSILCSKVVVISVIMPVKHRLQFSAQT